MESYDRAYSRDCSYFEKSRSSFALREALSLACSLSFYFLTYICWLLSGNHFCSQWAKSISHSVCFILLARLCHIGYSIIPVIAPFIIFSFYSLFYSAPSLHISVPIATGTFDINHSMLIFLVVFFGAAVFKLKFNSLELPVRGYLELIATAAVPAEK